MTPQPVPEAPPVSHATRGAVFIDKNGTLLDDVPNNVDPAQLRFRPGAFDALKRLADRGLALVVVTSEPGLGLGLFNRAALTGIEQAIADRVKDEVGQGLAGFFTCPHKPGLRGEPACLCRMPAAGLLRRAALSLRVDLARSWMIGDTLDDVEAGRRAGCSTVLIDAGRETGWRMSPLRTPHHRVSSLIEAADTILASPQGAPGLSFEIDVATRAQVDGVATEMSSAAPQQPSTRSPALRVGVLRGYELHPTREWL